MKKYRVVLAPAALDALTAYVDYIAVDQQSPLVAERWLQKAWSKVLTLRAFPHRCALAPENAKSRHEVRALRVDRCLFLYRVDETARTVRVLAFRHGSQMPLDLG